jgi:zinc protease
VTARNPRDSRPAPISPRPFSPPIAEEFELEGARVLLHSRRDLPLARLHFVFDGGAATDPLDRGGLSDLSAAMLREGAGGRDAVAFANALDSLGASFGVGAGSASVVAYAASLKSRARETVALLSDAILRPHFENQAFERVKTQTVGGLRQRDEQPAAAAAIAAARTLFGADHPLGRPADGRAETAARLSLADVRERWSLAAAERAIVLASGDWSAAEIVDLAGPILASRRELALAPNRRLSRPKIEAPRRAERLRVVLVDRAGAPQSVVQFAWPGVSYSDPRRTAFGVALSAFGGSFTSRLNQNLREKHGYTYGARARPDYFRPLFGDDPGFGVVVASASVQAEVTGAATREFLAEFARLKTEPLTAAEVSKAKATIRNARVVGCETVEGLAADLSATAAYGLPKDRNAREMERLLATTPEEVADVARTAIDPSGGVLVVAGDRRVVAPELRALGLTIDEERSTP